MGYEPLLQLTSRSFSCFTRSCGLVTSFKRTGVFFSTKTEKSEGGSAFPLYLQSPIHSFQSVHICIVSFLWHATDKFIILHENEGARRLQHG